MIAPEHLAYFKDLLEGRAELSWKAWFRLHEKQLTQDLPRATFLRLKFYSLEEAEKLLRQAGIEFTVSPSARRREEYYMLFADSALDEKGKLKPDVKRGFYDGAFGHFMDGNVEEGRRLLAAFVNRMKRWSTQKRSEELSDMCFDGELELQFGDPKIGRELLAVVAAFSPKAADDDLLNFAITRAKELIGIPPQTDTANPDNVG